MGIIFELTSAQEAEANSGWRSYACPARELMEKKTPHPALGEKVRLSLSPPSWGSSRWWNAPAAPTTCSPI